MRTVDEGFLVGRLAALGPAPRIVVSGNCATPWSLVGLIDSALSEWRAFVLNPQQGWPCRAGLVTETPFVGPGVRHDPCLEYIPMRLSLVPRLFSSTCPPDAVLLHTAPPRGGKVSLGIEVNILPAAIEQARRRGGLVIAQVNRHMPYTLGDAEIDVDDVDLAVEIDEQLPSPSLQPPDAVQDAIGERVARYVSEGGTLQFGIGQVPDIAAAHLRSAKRLGVWSEMASDGVLSLERAGALEADRPIVASFLMGSPELYAWAQGNRRLEMRRTEVVNDPGRIATLPAMLALNTALQVDLFAQANASFVRGRPYSGFGGQPDFVVGALHSAGGHAVIALRSWHDPSSSSNIVGLLGVPVSSFQHSVVITEHGQAEVFGQTRQAQARMLIEITADPRAREDLWDSARSLGLG